ncbi:MAG: hypothetical protein ACFFAO_02910, partial [Candidatus Hermodarchaeota archaeon]
RRNEGAKNATINRELSAIKRAFSLGIQKRFIGNCPHISMLKEIERILGNFGENEGVTILKYHPAEAIEIYISISDEYGIITKGDWTSTIKTSLLGKLIDYGRDLSFLIPWEGGAPIIATGFVNLTLPSPPLYVGDRTRIFLEKFTIEELSEIKKEKIKHQENRVTILEKQIKQNIIQSIREIRQQNFPNKGQKYEFKATNPRLLFKSITEIFKDLESIEEPIEEILNEEDQDYFASAVFLIRQNPNTFQLIDIQIAASQNSGTLIMWVTGENDKIISDILQRYDLRFTQLKQGLEQKVEMLQVNCPGCGADLPIKDIDINGLIKCKYCRNFSKIPKFLRY